MASLATSRRRCSSRNERREISVRVWSGGESLKGMYVAGRSVCVRLRAVNTHGTMVSHTLKRVTSQSALLPRTAHPRAGAKREHRFVPTGGAHSALRHPHNIASHAPRPLRWPAAPRPHLSLSARLLLKIEGLVPRRGATTSALCIRLCHTHLSAYLLSSEQTTHSYPFMTRPAHTCFLNGEGERGDGERWRW